MGLHIVAWNKNDKLQRFANQWYHFMKTFCEWDQPCKSEAGNQNIEKKKKWKNNCLKYTKKQMVSVEEKNYSE